jgi:ATP-dependent phosphoenolpyruvate carboxykinase
LISNEYHLYRTAELYEYAMLPEHLGSPDPNIFNTTITETGALSASSGLRTGRSPKDKRVVEDEITKDVSIVLTILFFIDYMVGQCEHTHSSLGI